MGLQFAHRGYAYQDLIIATRLTELIVGAWTSALVDKKLFAGDRFDDLTLEARPVRRERVQFKSSSNPGQLVPETFATDRRDLKLDTLIATVIADRDGPGRSSTSTLYRIVLNDLVPSESTLEALGLRATSDTAFIAGSQGRCYRFDAELIWPLSGALTEPGSTFAFLREEKQHRPELEWFCTHTVVELRAPGASLDLTAPGETETLLLQRLSDQIGAGSYPNAERSPVDVAAALIQAVLSARISGTPVDSSLVLQRTQLRQDFGAVARAHPIEPSIEVERKTTLERIARTAETAADSGTALLVVGPPGQGKSWASQRLQDHLLSEGWLVAEHYCFLGDADEERSARVVADRIIGSLVGRLADSAPDAAAEMRPRLAGDERALTSLLTNVLANNPHQRIALVIDGLDHVSRVAAKEFNQINASTLLAQRLSDLELPDGVTLIVFTQPGDHLVPLRTIGALTIDMPGLTRDQLASLARRWHLIPDLISDGEEDDAPGSVWQRKLLADFIENLELRSAGNALYATYLCREVLRAQASTIDPKLVLTGLPTFDGTLANYYSYLSSGLGEGKWVADIVALLDFAVSRAELREMRPDLGNRIDEGIERLLPVLIERSMQGGVRVYHESFARYWSEVMANDPPSISARLQQVATWLGSKGLFDDDRAFRYLLPTLWRAGRSDQVVSQVSIDFVHRAISAGHPSTAIRANLAVAARCAADLHRWPDVAQAIELSRAAQAYEFERLDILIEYADVMMRLLGASAVASRLLHNGRPTIPPREGIRLCAAVDAKGVPAPWPEYLEAYDIEKRTSNTVYGAESDIEVALGRLRGQLRVALNDAGREVNLSTLSDYLSRSGLPANAVIQVLMDTIGMSSCADLLPLIHPNGDLALALAENLSRSSSGASGEVQKWALVAAQDAGLILVVDRLLRLGVSVPDIERFRSYNRDALLNLTRSVQGDRIEFEGQTVSQWLDVCAIAARSDVLGLGVAEALVQGEGWYRCWLRFSIGLCRAEATETAKQPAQSLAALKVLMEDLRPFAGKPRSCDLYNIRETLASTYRRALNLLDDATWLDGIKVLADVSDKISTTISGEMSGPLPRDLLHSLVLQTSSPIRASAAGELLSTSVRDESGRRYYSDIARFRLDAARLELTYGDDSAARQQWLSACSLLGAYGWRKDITLYELLDPFEALIALDVSRAQERLRTLQPLCDRVVMHTDGRETTHARRHWWRLLAAADPVALSMLVVPKLLQDCNMPHELLDGARASLWRAHAPARESDVSGVPPNVDRHFFGRA